MGQTIHQKVTKLISLLKQNGERTTYEELLKLVYVHIGTDKRTVKAVNEHIQTLNLMEDEGNGILRIR